MPRRDKFQVSGKDLGALSLPDFCPRCFWLRRHVADGLPFQTFPGIFSSIDAYTKRVVHGWFRQNQRLPNWLAAALPEVTAYIDPPHHSKFRFVHDDSGIRLTGAPDGIFTRTDKSLVIVDYKTAKYTENQDRLLPMYETQLNAYALIAQQQEMGSVSGLALIYAQPVTTDEAACSDGVHVADGFRMGFSVHVAAVDLRLDLIPPLLERARGIIGSTRPPAGRDGCADCERVHDLLELASV